LAYGHLEVQSKSHRTIHQYFEEGCNHRSRTRGILVWGDGIKSSEVLDSVCLEAPRVSLAMEDMTMRKLIGTALIVISVNAQAGVYCDSHDPTIYGTPVNDEIMDTMAPDVIVGLAGDDVIKGLEENDIIPIPSARGTDNARSDEALQLRAPNARFRTQAQRTPLYGSTDGGKHPAIGAAGPPRSNPSLTAAIALGDADRLTPSHATLSVPHLKEPSHDHRHHQRWR
jgi:hypothetical protein